MTFRLRPYQREAVDAVRRDWSAGHTDVLGTAATGSGKAQPLYSRVLTPNGWRCMGELAVGDAVIGSDGAAHAVLGIFPQGEQEVYRVTCSDSTEAFCTADHLWTVQTKSQKNRGLGWQVKTLRDLMGDLTDGSGAAKWFLPLVAPVQFAVQEVPIHPYALGALLGNAFLYVQGQDKPRYIQFSSADQETVDRVGDALGADVSLRHIGNYDYYVSAGHNGMNGSPLVAALGDLGLMGKHAHQKFVPDCYKTNTPEVRLDVLRGLMDTDGSVNSRGVGEFATSSPQLAQDVAEIVRSLGGVTTIRERQPWYTYKGERRQGRTAYRLRVNLPMNPFLLERKARLHKPQPKQGRTKALTAIEPWGKALCQCILVDAPGHLYVTDDYILTHNTAIFLALLTAELSAFPERRALILAHRKELVEQPVERLTQFWPEWTWRAGIVMAERDECERQIVAATVQTLGSEARLSRLLSCGPIHYLITDECHHATADTYRLVYDRLRDANPAMLHLGVTATPIRADGEGLVAVYQKESFHYGIREMVGAGWLVPPRWLAIQTGISLAGVSKHDGDYSTKSLANVYETQNCFDLVVESHKRYAEGRQCIAFVETVEGAYKLAETFRAVGIAAEAADGTTRKGDRTGILKRFRRGETQVLCNVALWTEGLDVPEVSCIHQVRPTQSDGLYLQMVGRSLRPVPGKQDALILDYAPLEARNVVMLGDVLGVEVRKDAYVKETDEEGEVIGGFTFDGKVRWLTGDPTEIISRQLDYLELSPFSWYRQEGWLSLALGEASDGWDRTLVVTPPDAEGFLCLWGLARRAQKPSEVMDGRREPQRTRLIQRGTFEEISERADDIIDRYANAVLARRNKQWRRQPASEKQREFAERLHVWQEGMNRGDCAQAITHKLAVTTVVRLRAGPAGELAVAAGASS